MRLCLVPTLQYENQSLSLSTIQALMLDSTLLRQEGESGELVGMWERMGLSGIGGGEIGLKEKSEYR